MSLVGYFQNPYQKQQMVQQNFATLNLQTQLDKKYKEALLQRGNKLRKMNEFYMPERPVKPKDQWVEQDFTDDLILKLTPYIVNRLNIDAILNSIKVKNQLREFHDSFQKFRDEYLAGMQRAKARNVVNWYQEFRKKFYQDLYPEENYPQRPEGQTQGNQPVVGGAIRSSKSGIIGGRSSYLTKPSRMAIREAIRYSGNDNV